MSIQKLRTPKGLDFLSKMIGSSKKNVILFRMQELQHMFCALWTECVWQLADCSASPTKLLLSDHPVSVYNKACFPLSTQARQFGDPHVWQQGTHTFFPLNENRLLILTNLSWARDPYGNPLKDRPHPNLFRTAVFSFLEIQTHRMLSEPEVQQINYIIKKRARRYVAARDKAWLYPERAVSNRAWPSFGDSLLFMPDPRSMAFAGEVVVGYESGASLVMDEYGREPGHPEFKGKKNHAREWETYLAFQGEFARRFGPRRRGRTYNFHGLDNEEDPADFHEYHLKLERIHRKRPPRR